MAHGASKANGAASPGEHPLRSTLLYIFYSWSRFFAEKLPWAVLLVLTALTLYAAISLIPSRPQLSRDEIARLKRLAAAGAALPAAQSLPAAGTGGAPAVKAAQLSAEEIAALKELAKDSKSLGSLAESAKEILASKASAEQAEKLKEDVKAFLEWVIAIAGIFSIAQAIAAGFTAQSFTRQAERDIQELDQFKKDYGVIAAAGQAQLQAFATLKDAFKDGAWPDWRTKLYSTMRVTERQSVLSADRYLGYDLLLARGQASGADRETRNQQGATIRGLANFYASKFEYEQQLRASQWQDLERASHLLETWLEISPGDFAIHNDLGLVLCNMANYCRDELKDRSRALRLRLKGQEHYEASRRLQPRQQRAYYNLAVIAADLDRPANWPHGAIPQEFVEGLYRAIGLGRKALEQRVWETLANLSMETEIRYNLACFQALSFYCATVARRAAAPKAMIGAQDAGTVLKELAIVAEPARGTILRKYVESDYAADGDLCLFRSCLEAAQQGQLDALKNSLCAHAAED